MKYLGTIIVLLVVLAVLTLIIVNMVKRKKRGETNCGCGCENCASRGICHEKDKNK